MTNERLDSISEYGQDIGAQASKLKTVIVNMTDELSQDSSGTKFICIVYCVLHLSFKAKGCQ